MRRGTSVGHIYVSATVDASGMNEDIVDGVDGAGDGVERTGEEHGERYGEGFGDSLEDTLGPIMDRLGNTLSRRLSTRMGRGLRDAFNDNSATSLGARLGDALGESLADRVESSLAGVEDRISAAVSGNSGGGSSGGGGGGRGGRTIYPPPDPDDRFWQMTLRMNAEFDRRRGLMLDRASRMDADFERQRGLMVERAMAMNERFDRDRGRMLERAYDMNASFDRAQRSMIDTAYRDNERFDRDRGRMLDAAHRMNLTFDRTRTRMLDEAHRMNLEFEAGRRGGDGRTVPGGGTRNNQLGDSIGKMFGAGSRNNFLNLLGKSIANIINLTGRLSSGITKVTGIGGQGASVFSQMAVSGVALGAAMSIVAVLAAVLVSVMSALLAIVVALTSTIVSGLTAALAVAGGLLGAVAVAGGLAAIAFTSMTDAQSELLKADFKPLKAELTGIGQLMITQMIPYFSTWSANLQQALLILAPLASVMGDAFGRAGNTLTAALSGPGFQLLYQQLGVYLPNIVQQLSIALGGFLNGMAGLFAALLPYVNRFSTYLAGVATRFATWASSVQGQNQIADWMDRAVNALNSLWDATREVFGYIGDLLFSPQAQNAGNSLFDSLADSFRGFRDTLSQAMADGSLQKWFDDAIEFGGRFMDVIDSISDVIADLDNSGILDAVGKAFEVMGYSIQIASWPITTLVEGIGWLVDAIGSAIDPLAEMVEHLDWLNSRARDLMGLLGQSTSVGGLIGSAPIDFSAGQSSLAALMNAVSDNAPVNLNMGGSSPSLDDLISSGTSALNNTATTSGGYKPPAQYQNPYAAWAADMAAKSQNALKEMKKTMREVNKQVAKAIRDAAKAPDIASARSALSGAMDSALSAGQSMVDSAQGALDSATATLGSTSNAADTANALKEWHKRNRELMIALRNQERIEKIANRLNGQKRVDPARVANLVNGFRQTDATLSEYAAARARIAVKLEKANQKLADAIALRNDYRTAVTDAAKSFGDLLTAQAQSINGVEQALTAGDITTNLQQRLAKIRKFQEDLRMLLALGLSNDAYKQLVDGGVEQGGEYAAALVAGGQGAIQQVNGLTSQISAAAGSLGAAASSRLYQAGVDAAQGLVNGLESMSTRLDAAATRLGNSIARAIKKSLGIKSPSRVARDITDNVVGTLVTGLDKGRNPVGAAANRLGSAIDIAPSMEVARYTAAQSRAGVSGNPANNGDPRFRDLIVNTPTEDPKAVAHEVLNEVTGRLP